MELQVKRVSNNVVIVNADLDGEKTTVVIDTVNCERPTLFGEYVAMMGGTRPVPVPEVRRGHGTAD